MREIGIGLIGCGWMGRLHAASYARMPYHYPDAPVRPRLVVAADPDPERAREAVDRLGFERAQDDWRAVIDDPAVEALSIAAPNFLHREIGEAAAAAGKPFWIEKPAGRSPRETAAIADAAAGIVTTVGLNYRHVPAVIHARELIDRIGAPTHVRGWFHNSYAADPRGALSWRFRRELGGSGALGDLMSHALDLLLFVVGPIAELCGQDATFIPRRPVPPPGGGSHFALIEDGELAPVENEDYAAALLRFAGGARGAVEASRVSGGAPCSVGFEIHGPRGALRWDFERMNQLEVALDGAYTIVPSGPGHGDYERFQPGRGIAMGYDDLKVIEAHGFCMSVADGVKRPPGMPEALAMAQALDAIERSCASGAWEPVRALTQVEGAVP